MNYFYMFLNVSKMYSKCIDNQIVTYYVFYILVHLRYIWNTFEIQIKWC